MQRGQPGRLRLSRRRSRTRPGAVHAFDEMHLAAGNWLHSVHDQLNLSGVAMERGHLDEALSYARKLLWPHGDSGWSRYSGPPSTPSPGARHIWRPLRRQSAGSGFEEALASYRRAADVVELLRSRIDRPEERESLLTDKEGIYEQAIMLCVAMRRGKDAFEFCERARMRSFLEALGSSRLERLEADDPATDRHDQLSPGCSAPRRRSAKSKGSWMSYGSCVQRKWPATRAGRHHRSGIAQRGRYPRGHSRRDIRT